MSGTRRDFYEIQRLQWKKSLVIFAALILFYFAAVGLVSLAALLSAGIFVTGPAFWTGRILARLLLFDFGISALFAFFHFYDARRFGAEYILKRLQALPPDAADLYHKRFIDTLEEIRIASGAPRAEARVLPMSAVNSMALVGRDGTPVVAVTEGMLAECSRDELQAVAAHELAHIVRGDAIYVTLVCSLANLFERLREALEPERPDLPAGIANRRSGSGGSGAPLIWLAVTLSSLVMRLLSTLVSRERETLADAAAVEFGRDPRALARAIYKAHVRNSFVGDFAYPYSPLFIVPPDSRNITDGVFDRLFQTHPPLMKRIETLAGMAGLKSGSIVREVWEMRQDREQARTLRQSVEESGESGGTSTVPDSGERTQESVETEVWSIRDRKGAWEGPMSLGRMVSLPRFTSLIEVRNSQEGIEARAREFPQVRLALHNMGRKTPIDPARRNRCPRCRTPLAETFYEGVPVKECPKCRGKLLPGAMMGRILVRKETGFSEDLVRKAVAFREKFLAQPVRTRKISETQPAEPLCCPDCGYSMKARPYSYSYFLPVDKCLACDKIWFDADELEILQILIEQRP
ncbi:MAG: M48 family metalloprotease [Candidatus Aminicenantales bacterium]